MKQTVISIPADPSTRRDVRACSVSVVRPDDLDRNALSQWADLADDVEQPNPYFAPWFLGPAIEHLDLEKAVRLLVIREDHTDRMVGLMPVTVGSSYARLPIKHLSVWKNNHIYTGTPLIRLGYAKQAAQILIDWIGTCPLGLRFIRFTQLPADGPVYHAIRAACAECARETLVQTRERRPVLRNGHDFESLLTAASSTKQRAELRRRIRRLDGTESATLTETPLSENRALALAERFLEIENTGWKRSDDEGFALAKTEAESRFFRDVMRKGAKERRILAAVLEKDSSPIAIGLTLRAQDMLFGFKTAFDRDYRKYSPGVRLFHETTRRMLASRDIALYDSCAAPDHPIVGKLWPDRLDIVQLNVPASGAKNARLLRFAAHAGSTKDKLLARWA